MDKLIHLNKEDFGRETHAALAYAREWALTRGVVSNHDILAEFEACYNERQRRDILAAIRCMDFANRFMNTLTGQYLDEKGASCELPLSEEPPGSART